MDANSEDSASAAPKLLIIFILVLIGALSIFVIVYYYCVRGLRSSNLAQHAQKSTSGSIADEKSRNIFAHPERQLAVDQSTRASPSPSSLDGERNSPAHKTPAAPKTVPIVTKTPSQAQPQQHPPPPAPPQATSQSAAPTQASQIQPKQPQQTQPKQLQIEVDTKSKSKSNSQGKDMTMVGTLAELRETMKHAQ